MEAYKYDTLISIGVINAGLVTGHCTENPCGYFANTKKNLKRNSL